MLENQRSIIMCMTPLQLLIAEKIIQLNSGNEFDLILVVKGEVNEKYLHYYNRVKKLCHKALLFVRKSSGFSTFVKFVSSVKSQNMDKGYQSIYLANINTRYFQYIASININANLYTFDDGIANITSFFFKSSDFKASQLKKMLWRAVGINFFTNDLIDRSLLHYTLYSNIPNIIDKTVPISLIDEVQIRSYTDSKIGCEKVKFFLGQPLEGLDPRSNEAYILSCLKQLNIDYYFKHPRETYNLDKKCNLLNSPLIFEDFIINFLKENPNKQIEVYSFVSSALLNISNVKSIKLFYVYNEKLYETYQIFYELVEKNFNVTLINIG